MNIPILRYRLEDSSALLGNTLHQMLHAAGYAALEVSDDSYDVFYGHSPQNTDPLIWIEPNTTHILWDRLLQMSPDSTSWNELVQEQAALNYRIPFDLINATALLLTDAVNQGIETTDHDWLEFELAFQGRSAYPTIPIVNGYVLFMKDLLYAIKQQAGLPLLPDGKQCAVCLSHDVDRIQRPGFIKSLLYLRYSGIRPLLTSRAAFTKFFNAAFLNNPSDFQLFRETARMEMDFGARSTFFFSAWGFSR